MASDLLGEVIPQAWLPGETLFSLCSRHHRLSKNHRASSTCLQLFGHRSQGSAHDLPSRIGYFVDVTRGQLGGAESIIRSHTVLPFYLPFAVGVAESGVLATMAGTSIGSLKYQLGLLTSRFRANHPLKACPACMSADRLQWGASYWHVQHQLPGVWVCPVHGESLAQSNLKASGVGRFQWFLPAASHMTASASGTDEIGSLSRLSRLAIWLWSRPADTRFDPMRVSVAYRLALRDKGLIRGEGRGRLIHKEIGELYAEFVRPLRQIDELRALPDSPQAAAREVGRLTYAPRSGLHPLRHLALIGWLYGEMDMFVDGMRRQMEPIECVEMERDAPRGEESKAQLRIALFDLVAGGCSVSTASRQLGIDPHTGMAWLTNEGVVTNKRPSLLKDDVRNRMISALKRGAAKSDVAAMGVVSIESVTRLLRTEVGLREQWMTARNSNAQRHARNTWIKLITANPNSGVNAVRMLRPEIYAWLYRNDRDWLVAQSQGLSVQRNHGGSRVDWDARDQDLAIKVAQVAMNLASEAPGRRVKLWQIYQKLPDLKAKLGHLDQLPLTQSAIKAALRAETDGEASLCRTDSGQTISVGLLDKQES
jgi:hypothetical protein